MCSAHERKLRDKNRVLSDATQKNYTFSGLKKYGVAEKIFMDKINILWADDEIDLLRPHILFLKEKGYEVATANSGDGALDLFQKQDFDIVFLDENMPGLSGLETLSRIKSLR